MSQLIVLGDGRRYVATSCRVKEMTQPGNSIRGIYLRPVTEDDLPILFEHQLEPEANQMAAFPAREYNVFMAHWTKILDDETVVAMAGVSDGCVAGNIGCWMQGGQRRIGYWIGKKYWGKGIATQMLSMFLRMVNERPLHAHVAKHNIASIRVLEKCGFVLSTEATNALGEPTDGIEALVYTIESVSNVNLKLNTPQKIG